MKKIFLYLILVASITFSCNASRQATNGDSTAQKNKTGEDDSRMLPPVVVESEDFEEDETALSVEPVPYNPSAKREHDLIHTKLDLHFDWKLQQVLGKATLTLKPYFYPSDKVTLEAKNFDFHKITFEGQATPLKYEYDGAFLTIQLGRMYNKNEEYKLFIDYTAKPEAEGGSAAISSDKGLFFINPLGDEPNKPQQIWTQGETENNSRWFPTFDKPNERCTQEMYLTVENRFKTLSNGVMLSSKQNTDGTRTDYWKMDKPHAPYLFMIAIGEFAVVKDKWNGIDVEYYVEPEYEPYARNIFPHTPEMLAFFSDKLGITYPWSKYAQVVVRDYVSGAMENTTAVIFGEFMQGTDQELIDVGTNELVVAHEMFHHWFGDLVTCESWSNLTLNEGFANYSEYLWLEHKHGKDAADNQWHSETESHINSTAMDAHPLIHFGYEDKESMFDSHSYNKGGSVLHMLRNYVGDDAFFAALNLYLTRNAYTEVEADELRLAFEDVTGEDLNWFFNQWFFSTGHPEVEVSYDYDINNKVVVLHLAQTQEQEDFLRVFDLPLTIDVYDANGNVKSEKIRFNEREQTFEIKSDAPPALVNFDADRVLLGTVYYPKSSEEYVFQYRHAPKFMDRFEALTGLQEIGGEDLATVVTLALNDKFWGIRQEAVHYANVEDMASMAIVSKLAVQDPHSNVRSAALSKLAETGDKQYIPVFKNIISSEKSVFVISDAVNALYGIDPEEGLKSVEKLESSDNVNVLGGIAEIYASTKDPKYLPFFERTLPKMTSFSKINFLGHYGMLASYAGETTMQNTLEFFKKEGLKETQQSFDRFGYAMGLTTLRKGLKDQAAETSDEALKNKLESLAKSITEIVGNIRDKEPNEQIKMFYMQLITTP